MHIFNHSPTPLRYAAGMESQQPDTQQAAPSRSGVSRREVLRIGGVGSLATVASTLIGGILGMLCILLADLAYVFADPRVSYDA